MIEPQNTVMPLPAEPAAADVPDGDAGFGAMLAHTLGMVPQLDRSAIPSLVGQGGDKDDNGPAGDSDADSQLVPELDIAAGVATGGPPPAQRHNGAIDVDGLVPVAAPKTMSLPRLPVITPPTVDVAGDAPAASDTPIEGSEVQTLPLPTPPPPDGGEPGVDIWSSVVASPLRGGATDGVSDSSAAETTLPEPVATEVAHSEPAPSTPASALPAPGEPLAAVGEAAHGVQPDVATTITPPVSPPPVPRSHELPEMAELPGSPLTEAGSQSDQGTAAIAGAVATPVPDKYLRKPIDPIAAPGLPSPPSPVAEAPQMSGVPATQADAAEPHAPLPRVEMGSDLPVRLLESDVQLSPSGPIPVGDQAAAGEATTGAVPSAMPIGEGAPLQAGAVTDFTAPAMPTQNTALAERVMQAVELQANQPPPRTMVVDIPEIEGLRLVVSVRAGSEVHVVPSTSSTTSDGLQPFMDELHGVLADRGFVMTGDGRRGGRNPNQDERSEPHPSQPTPVRRPQPTDDDLRI